MGIIVCRTLPHRIRRIADDNPYGGASLGFDGFGVFAEEAFEDVAIARFAQLEGICEAESIKGQILRLWAYLLEYALDIYIGNIVSQQDYFVGMNLRTVFMRHIFGADKPRLQETCDECTRPSKGVKDMYIFVGEGGAKLCFQNIVYAVENEVHTLHRGIDGAEFLHRERECPFEELFVEVFDDRLLALKVVNLAHICSHRFVEGVERIKVFVHRLSLEQIYHELHRRGYGVVAHELIVGKEDFEDGASDEVLCEHLDALLCRDTRVEVGS